MFCAVRRRAAQSRVHRLFDRGCSQFCASHLQCLFVNVDQMLAHVPSIYREARDIYPRYGPVASHQKAVRPGFDEKA